MAAFRQELGYPDHLFEVQCSGDYRFFVIQQFPLLAFDSLRFQFVFFDSCYCSTAFTDLIRIPRICIRFVRRLPPPAAAPSPSLRGARARLAGAGAAFSALLDTDLQPQRGER